MKTFTLLERVLSTINGLPLKTRFSIQGFFSTAAVVVISTLLAHGTVFPKWWDVCLYIIIMINAPLGLYGIARYALIKHEEDKAALSGKEERCES